MAFNAAIFTGMGKAARRRQQEERTQREARGATLLGIWKDLVQSPNATPELVSHGTRNIFQLATADPGDPKSYDKVLKNTGKLDIWTEGIQPTTPSGMQQGIRQDFPGGPIELPGVPATPTPHIDPRSGAPTLIEGPAPQPQWQGFKGRPSTETLAGIPPPSRPTPGVPLFPTGPFQELPGATIPLPTPPDLPPDVVEAMRIPPFKTPAQLEEEARRTAAIQSELAVEAAEAMLPIEAEKNMVAAPAGLERIGIPPGTLLDPPTLTAAVQLVSQQEQYLRMVYQQAEQNARDDRARAAARSNIEFVQASLNNRATVSNALQMEMKELPVNLSNQLAQMADEYQILNQIEAALPLLRDNVGGIFGSRNWEATLKERIGILPAEESAALSLVRRYITTRLHRLSGAAVSPAEHERIQATAPDPSRGWETFVGRLGENKTMLEEFMGNRLRAQTSPVNQEKVLTVLSNFGLPQDIIQTFLPASITEPLPIPTSTGQVASEADIIAYQRQFGDTWLQEMENRGWK